MEWQPDFLSVEVDGAEAEVVAAVVEDSGDLVAVDSAVAVAVAEVGKLVQCFGFGVFSDLFLFLSENLFFFFELKIYFLLINQEPRTKNQEPRTKNQEPRTKNQEPRTKNQEMLRRDYMQRMIEEFAKVLGHIMGLKALDKYDQGLEELHDAYKTYFGIEFSELDTIPPEDFVSIITKKNDLKTAQLDSLARALNLESELYPLNQIKTYDFRMKSLLLLRHLEIVDNETFSVTRKNAIKELERLLKMDE